MSRRVVKRFMERMQSKLGFKIHSHKFRHTFVVISLMSGVPVNVVQEWVAHSSLIVTSVYAKVISLDTYEYMRQVR